MALKSLRWVVAIAFVVFYPMMISIYVFLPLFIGFSGYLFIKGIVRKEWLKVAYASLYFTNLEANLSLPYFMMPVAVLTVYLLFYPKLNLFKDCASCKAFLLVTLIDTIYLGLLLLYDLIFGTQSIVLDMILVYSLIVDMLLAVVFP